MKKTILIILALFTMLPAFGENIIVVGEDGIRFKLWWKGQSMTSDFTNQVSITEVPGYHECRVETENGEVVEKKVLINDGFNGVIYRIKYTKKGKLVMRLDQTSGSAPSLLAGGSNSTGSAKPATSKKGEIKFDDTFVEVGKVDQGGILDCAINVKSSGDEALVISKVSSTDRAVSVLNFPTHPIPSGQSVKINLRITGGSSEGRQVARVTVEGNTFMGNKSINLEYFVTDKVVQVAAAPTPAPTRPDPTPRPAPTASATIPNTSMVQDSRDQQTYRTVKIGGQWWFAENLRYQAERSFAYGTPTEVKKLGYLYSWPAITKEQLCPAGWHVATDGDWETLARNLGGSSGESAKSAREWDGNGNSGLEILPAGLGSRKRSNDDWQISTSGKGTRVGYWSPILEKNGSLTTYKSISRLLYSGNPAINRTDEGSLPASLYYCRCVMD